MIKQQIHKQPISHFNICDCRRGAIELSHLSLKGQFIPILKSKLWLKHNEK